MTEVPIQWLKNQRALENPKSSLAAELFPAGLPQQVRRLHSDIPGYRMSPLKSLPRLARRIGVGGIWVKDESARLSLNSFKVLGGSYAIYKALLKRGGFSDQELSLRDLLHMEGGWREKLGHPIFATATDGNHGTGVAWAATKMGFPSVIYVHSLTTKDRIRGIERQGGRVVVVDGNYDDAVRQASLDAQKNGWEVISDTSWEGYEDVPKWIMQGYATMFVEAQEQFSAQGIQRPTHLLVQAGVGSLAAAAIGFYSVLFEDNIPLSMVVEPTKAACLYESMRINDGKPHKRQASGAGLVREFLENYRGSLSIGELSGTAWEEITSTGKVSQSYDLWHHDGEEKHVNTYLSMFFKEWERSNRDKFNTMQTSPEHSHALMFELVQSWAIESLDSKLSIGEAATAEHGKQCRALCETAYEVKLPVVGYDKVKIGFIPGENLKVSVSTLGSIAVREYGWDVMVMIAAVKDNCYILTLRSNESGTNVDVSDICDQIGKGPFGLTGGGHRNAAGCTIRRGDLQEVASKVLSL